MKLIDLLVQDLKFWPSSIDEAINIPKSGDYHWYDTGGLAARIVASSNERDGELVTIGQWSQAKRNQQETGIAASQRPAWNGEGLPTVGSECEWLASGDHDWIGVKVLAYHEDEVWLKPLNGAQSFTVGNPDDFRPIRTEAERKRDDRISTLNGFIDGFMKSTNGDHSNLGEALYEWLAVLDRLK